MNLHLVTDRHRLWPGADGRRQIECLVEQAQHAVTAGVDVIQVRERDLDARALADLTRRLVHIARGSATRILVNDRVDVALAAAAAGVHLPGHGTDAARVRLCTPPGFVIGRSVHSAEEAIAAGPVDYLVAGTVFATTSKPEGHALLGVDGLAAIVRAARVPVVAIGGIDPDRAGDVAAAGAKGVAAIGAWMRSGDGCRASPLEHVTEAFRRGFDAANMSAHSFD